jgi:hypothetical protein
MKYIFLFLILLSRSAFAGEPLLAETCADGYAAVARRHVQENGFEDARALGHYRMDFCCGFQAALDALQPGDVILDVGSGKGVALAMVIRDYKPKPRLFGWRSPAPGKPIGIGVSIVMNPDRMVNEVLASNPDNLKFITKKFVEDIPASELGRPKIIADFFGALSYTNDVERVLQKYVDVLRSDGKIFIRAGSPGKTTFLKNGVELNMVEFLKTVPGLAVEEGMTGSSFAIRKTSAQVTLPKLKLKSFETVNPPPPRRVFEVLE